MEAVKNNPEYKQDFDYMNDGKPIAVRVFGKFHNECRVNLLHKSSLGVCPTSDDYFAACSAWLAHIGITNMWYLCNNLESMSVETEFGDVICEFHR